MMDAIRIREATIDDARAIAAVQVAGWHAAYRGLVPDAVLDGVTMAVREPAWVKNLAESSGPRTTVLERGGRVVAFGCFGPSRYEEGLGEVWALYVAPEAWRTGAGRALLHEGLRSLDAHPAVMLWVLEGNARAIRFYEACGFRLDGTRLDKDALPQLGMRRGRS